MKSIVRAVLICSLFITCQTLAKPIIIQSTEDDVKLPSTVLRTVLSQLDTEFVYYGKDSTVSKLLEDLNNGDVDIVWQMTSPQLEQDFEPIYFPIYRGTLGMRLGIVKRENRHLFNNVNTLGQLRQYQAGQGKGWADTLILEDNQIKVAKSHKYENLFHMLEGERFDYFPRGLFEPWGEVERFADLNLVVEPNLVIHYVAPMYFYVRKDNKDLARKISNILQEMAQTGEYQKLFFADEDVAKSLKLSNIKARRFIKLDNPSLSSKTPLNRAEFWYNPAEGAE